MDLNPELVQNPGWE
ncbi:MAG: hypothetical protein ACQEQ0_13810 [Bacteroidota bacterium]